MWVSSFNESLLLRLFIMRLLLANASFNASCLMRLLLMRLIMRLINASFGSAGTVLW